MIQKLHTTLRSPFDHDSRGLSEVIGFILLFGLVVAGVTLVQAYGVPAQNERIEFNHNLRVQDDMTVLGDNVETAGLSDASISTTLEVGTDYPSRLFLFNPAPPAGTIRTGDATAFTVSNATATGEAGDYWNGTDRTFDTRPIVYQPGYNVYGGAPTTHIEYGVVYNDNPRGSATVLKRGSLVRGDRISLVTVDGTFDRGSSQSISVEAVPLSAPSQSVTLTPTQPLTLAFGSSLPVADWRAMLAEENTTNGGHVTAVSAGPTAGTVIVTLEPNVSYDLRMARVGLESGYDRSVSEEAYLSVGTEDTLTVAEGTEQTVAFDVRDQFNNPVTDVSVSLGTKRSDSTLSATTVTTDSAGRATVTYTAPQVTGRTTVTDRVNASFEPTAPLGADFDGTVPESASVSLTVLNTDSSGISTSETGEGGESEWSESENEQTISVANGRWNNISHVESITLSEGELVTTERCKTGSAGTGNGAGVFTECKFIDTLRLSFSLSNASDDYTADVNLEDCNQDGDFTGSCTVDKLTFDEERTVTIYDSDGGIVFEQSLRSAATTGILSGTGTDILAIDSYTAGSQSTLDRLKLDDSMWLTGHTQGRVTVTVSST